MTKCKPIKIGDRRKLASEAFDAAYKGFESFREQDVGADLAYLMGAILDVEYAKENGEESFVDWTAEVYGEQRPSLLKALKERFPKDSRIWEFIRL